MTTAITPSGGTPVEPGARRGLRLGTKLALSFLLAALVPVMLVAALGVRVIQASLERTLRDDAERQLDVGLNLVLRAAERLGDDLFQITSSGDLVRAMATGPSAVAGERTTAVKNLAERISSHLPSGVLQIIDASGALSVTQIVGDTSGRFNDIALPADAPLWGDGRRWAQRVTLEAVGDRVVVRAVAPIVDSSLALLGVAVLSVPLDGDFADGIKGALGTDVMIVNSQGRGPSTFRDADGARKPPVDLSALGVRLGGGGRERRAQVINLAGGEYAVALSTLVDQHDQRVGWFGVAVGRRSLAAAKRTAVSLMATGGAVALAIALGLAMLLSRRIGRPIADLHRGAIAVARGDLDHHIDVPAGDEIADLAAAFDHMTKALKENQARLAARMREIVALHDAGRAVSSGIDLAHVMRKAVDSISRTFDVRLCGLWLVDGSAQNESLASTTARGSRPDLPMRRVRLGAARVRRADVSATLAMDEDLALARSFDPLAIDVAISREVLRIAGPNEVHPRAEALTRAGIDGSLLAAPLERKGAVVGVLVLARGSDGRPFTEADVNLLTTFADQATSAIENARLYEEVRDASEDLERKVKLRTAELTAINSELGRTLADLRDTQAQLVLSERLAGLGLLVAGVAHEINSPTAAIRGSVDALNGVVKRLSSHVTTLAAVVSSPVHQRAVLLFIEDTAPELAQARLPTGPAVRQHARELRTSLEAQGRDDLANVAPRLAELGISDAGVSRLTDIVTPEIFAAFPTVVDHLADAVMLIRTVITIQGAIHRIQRIVGSLKSYSHLDQQAARTVVDLHDGLDTTLTLFDHALRDIVVTRRLGSLPQVPVYVDELNQVWTNLIQNAVQALGGRGQIVVESERAFERAEYVDAAATPRDGVVVRVIDDGPGIPPEVLPHIFDSFFTTKAKGEGSGLGLGIVRRIVDKHQGHVACVSQPGRTCFEVWLPTKVRSA